MAFGGEKDTHQVIYQTIYQKRVISNKNMPMANQPAYIKQSYSREYYYRSCMAGHQKPITSVEAMAGDIANQLVCSELTPIRAPIGVSVIVDLNRLHETTDFGRLLSEDLISELQRKNMAVIDIRAQTFMLINPQGEFYLSRNINNLRKEYKIGYVLVGTYSVGDYSTSVNARIIDASSGFVVATAHASIPTQIISDLLYNSSQSIPELQLRGSSMAPSYQNLAQSASPPAVAPQVKPNSKK
ncbi:hypothetical protein JCM8795_00240 [Hydrogenobaculum acidophilum]